MADEYELKQVKVRLKLSEAEPLYSTEAISTPDKAAEVMAQALAQMDREYCCVVNLDSANHPINFNVVSIGDVNQAQIPIQNVFKSAILSNAASIMMFHNHPSGSLKASREDIDVTKRLIEAGRIMNIPVLDHIIVAGGTAEHFSFRDNSPDMFAVREAAEYSVHEPQARLDPDKLMVRPTYRNFGVYETIGINRARVLFEGNEQECRDKIKELRDRQMESRIGDSFTIYQLKDDDDSLHYIRFEGLDRLQKEGQTVDKDNYNVVYEAPLKPGTTLDDLYYQFNMRHPLDFRGHSLSVSDVVVLHQKDEDRAFYVDSFGFTELPDFLLEKTAEREVDEAAYKLGDRYISIQRTEEGFDYSIYDEGYHLLDGGVYDDPKVTIGEVLQQVTEELKAPFYDETKDTYSHTKVQGNIRQGDILERTDFEGLMEKVDEVGQSEIAAIKSAQSIVDDFRANTERLFHSDQLDNMRPAEIEEAVRERVQQVIDDFGIDARIEDVIISGSRCRGLEGQNSDLDVVVSFSGSEREDSFFNTLHEERIYFGSVELDINPVGTEQTGTLAEYLPGVEKYLSEKAAEAEQQRDAEIPEREETFGQNVQKPQEDMDAVKPVFQTAGELAAEIDAFAYEYDAPAYQDTVKDRDENIRGIAQSIEEGQDGGARAYLNSFIQESDDAIEQAKAKELLQKLNDYKPLAKVEEMEEQNYNMIDNVINNLPPDPEEKKEPAPQKTVRIEEHKKIRKRVSMKAKLAEKKAEIEQRDKKAPEAARVKEPTRGVED